MQKDQGALVANVVVDSIAEEVELEKGDKIVSINGFPLVDWIDYCYFINESEITMDVEKQNGEMWEIEIEKDVDEDLGIEFQFPIFDGLKNCHNQCVFCFVDQMPSGLRETLYMKDDDYRLSFLHGNYMTLTNLSEKEIDRIIELRLSPLYISVHVTDPQVRCKMMNNKQAGKILRTLQRLADGGISFHTQIVLCPDINDGIFLEQSIKELSGLWPHILSLAIVPVGLTRYREDLFPLKTVDKRKAQEIINQIQPYQEKFEKMWGCTWVYLSDEFYLMAEETIPPRDNYDDFPQTENGVGLVRLFLDEFADYEPLIPKTLKNPREVTLVTGVSAGKFLRPIVEKLKMIKGLMINLEIIKNNFFGDTVTVAGLITGGDIIKALKDKKLGDAVLIPWVMLKDNQPVFIDDLSVSEVEKSLNVNIQVIEETVNDFLDKIMGTKDWRNEDVKTCCNDCRKT